MNTRIIFILLLCMVGVCFVAAQDHQVRRERTPEEEAAKQTERLIRELGIKDSLRIDTLYKMHLKYAQLRRQGLTRAENVKRMYAIYSELTVLLTPEELERFMNHPTEQPRRPHGACVVSAKGEAARRQEKQSHHR
ncbi:MAG: hypothetical protein UHJ11_05730 [Paludibacteraceae bacterium]|nr:hypothetical protein [Paludibacteraceae bacterium]